MRRLEMIVVTIVCCGFYAALTFAQPQTESVISRETARSSIIRFEKELILDIPKVSSLCDQMDVVKRLVNVGDCNLYCEIEGDGIPIVLLHGGPGATHHHFHPFFSMAKDFAKIIYYDQRGCGISDYKKGEGYSIEQAVEDLENLRKSLKIERWIVLGNSYGGLLAQCYSVKYPENVSGLILVTSHTAMPFVTVSRERQSELLSDEERAKISSINLNNKLIPTQKFYNAFLNGDWKRQCYYKPSKKRIAQIVTYGVKHDPDFTTVMDPSLARVDLQGAFNNCPIPTMIMEGRWDLTWNTDKPEILHKNHPNAKLMFLEESAHMPYGDEPEKFFDTLQDFVLKLPKIASTDLQQWKECLSTWKKEKAKQVKQKEERRKKDPFLASEMTEPEAQAIEEFRKIKKKILGGEKYEDSSTPLRALLTFLSALNSRDVEAYKRIYAVDLDKIDKKYTSEWRMADSYQYLIGFDILRAPPPPEQPEHGTFWPIYVRRNNETILADTIVPVFLEGKWMWIGNMGVPGDWRSCIPTFKDYLERFGNTHTAFAEVSGNTDRERARDGIVHIEKEVVLNVPQVPRLCDQMDVVKSQVNVGDCNLYCEIEGDGVPMVLLHGGPGATHHYFHPSFSRAKDFAKIIYYDQRGCGISDYKKGKGYSIEQAVNDLESLRQSLNVKKWVVIGSSYGGVLAQCYTVKYPKSVSGLVLVGSGVAMPVVMKSTRQYEFISNEERAKIKSSFSNSKLTSEQKLYNAWINGDWKRQFYYKPSTEYMAQIALYEWKRDSNFNSIMSREMERVDLKGAFNDCPIPTMIMEGRWDLTWNTDKPEILHKNHPNAKLLFFEESAHLPFDDEPEKFFNELQDFVLKLPKIASSDLQQWKEYRLKWKKEKGKQVKLEEKEKRKEDPFLASEMTEAEAQAIEEFREIKKKIRTGQKYNNTSTPLRVFLSFLSALHYRDAKAVKRVSALNLDKMGINLTNEVIADWEEELIQFDILRAPPPPEQPEHGTFWPIYVKRNNETILADTLLPVYWKDRWMWFGNAGPASEGNWRSLLPQMKSVLEKFGK